MASLDHLHPLTVSEAIDLGNGKRETVLNTWGTASLCTEALEEQGPDGQAANFITASLVQGGFSEAATAELIQQVLAGDEQSQARLRILQQQLADSIHGACEKAFGQEGPR